MGSISHLCKPFSGIPLPSGLKPVRTWTHLQGFGSSDLGLPSTCQVPQSTLGPTTLSVSQEIPSPAHYPPLDQHLLLLQNPGRYCFFRDAWLHSPDGVSPLVPCSHNTLYSSFLVFLSIQIKELIRYLDTSCLMTPSPALSDLHSLTVSSRIPKYSRDSIITD